LVVRVVVVLWLAVRSKQVSTRHGDDEEGAFQEVKEKRAERESSGSEGEAEKVRESISGCRQNSKGVVSHGRTELQAKLLKSRMHASGGSDEEVQFSLVRPMRPHGTNAAGFGNPNPMECVWCGESRR
jgi:hypothetical protein